MGYLRGKQDGQEQAVVPRAQVRERVEPEDVAEALLASLVDRAGDDEPRLVLQLGRADATAVRRVPSPVGPIAYRQEPAVLRAPHRAGRVAELQRGRAQMPNA